MSFGSNTSAYCQEQIELPFFNHFLRGKGEQQLPEASVFETGTNRWRKFDAWPPTGTEKVAFYFHPKGRLAVEKPLNQGDAADSFPSDPNRPVPYTNTAGAGMVKTYMAEDQRAASRRPDVLVYQSGVLPNSLTLAGLSSGRRNCSFRRPGPIRTGS